MSGGGFNFLNGFVLSLLLFFVLDFANMFQLDAFFLRACARSLLHVSDFAACCALVVCFVRFNRLLFAFSLMLGSLLLQAWLGWLRVLAAVVF